MSHEWLGKKFSAPLVLDPDELTLQLMFMANVLPERHRLLSLDPSSKEVLRQKRRTAWHKPLKGNGDRCGGDD